MNLSWDKSNSHVFLFSHSSSYLVWRMDRWMLGCTINQNIIANATWVSVTRSCIFLCDKTVHCNTFENNNRITFWPCRAALDGRIQPGWATCFYSVAKLLENLWGTTLDFYHSHMQLHHINYITDSWWDDTFSGKECPPYCDSIFKAAHYHRSKCQ